MKTILRRSALPLLLLLLTLGTCFSVCTVSAASTKTVSVTLKKAVSTKKKTVKVGDKLQLKLTYKKLILANGRATIRSSNSGVATVAGNGTVLIKKAGSAVITATYRKRGVKIALTAKAAAKEKANTASAQILLPDDVILWDDWLDSEDSTSGPNASSSSGSSSSSAQTSSSVSSLRSRIVSYAKSFVGVLPYVWGGNSLKTGTDCSGFIHLIYAHFGISAPRSASEFQSISNISYSSLKPGDIVVYKYGGHVALYIGDGKVAHAKGAAYGTCIDSMWYGSPTGYVRLIKD